MERRTQRQWHDDFALNAYWFGLSFMWNSLHPILLPVLLLPFVAEEAKNTLYGMLTFVGLIVALVVQPLSGALSDHTRHRAGRRRPWILLGTALAVVWLLMLGLARTYWVIAVGYVLLQFSSNLAHGPAQGLIPDLVPKHRRGTAAGIKNLLDMTGVIAAALVTGHIMGGADPSSLLAIAPIVIVLLTSMTVTLVGARETAAPDVEGHWERSVWQQARSILSVDLHAHRDYGRLLLSRFLVLLGVYSVQSFVLYYFRDALRVEAPARMVGNLMAAVGLSIALSAYPSGALSERWGRKAPSLVACGMAALGMGLLSITRDMKGIWILGCVIGLGMGMFASVNWAWATDLVPAAEAGKYLGLSNLATAGSAAASRLLGPLIDSVNTRLPNAGYLMLFALAALAALAGLVVTLFIPETRPLSVAQRHSRGPDV